MKSFLLFIAFLFFTSISFAQTWRSAYYPTNWSAPTTKNFYTDAFLQDYSYAGYQYGEKTMVVPSLTLYDVTKSPYNADKTGVTDATAAIQKAIDDAQTNNGGVVYLPAGTYKVNPGTGSQALRISKSNIYLKGDGVGKTFILNTSYQMNNKSIIKVTGSASWTSIPSSKALLTADIMNPVNVIPVDNTSLFKVGDLIMVRNVIGDEWITEHKETEWLGFGSSLRGLMYCRYVTGVDAANKTITLDIPLRYALKTRDGACAFKLSGMISEVGLTDFSIGNVQNPASSGFGENDYSTSGTAGYNCHASYVINYNAVVHGWMKNISTYKMSANSTGTHILSNGVLVQYSKNVTVDNCAMSYAQYGGGGGNGYAYRVSANEVLISNSTANYIRHGFVFSSMWCSGNVFHKSNDVKTGIQCGSTGSETTSGWGSDHHMHFSQSNLIDQCYSENSAFVAFYRPYGSDPKHRLTSTHTAFWNTSSGGTKGYCVWTQQSRYGYAIGSSGTSSTLKTSENTSGSASKTDPVDIMEGQGLGATLVPQSLYKDQLQKRLGASTSCSDVRASSDDGNIATNVLDKDLGTRWSANGDGEYLEFCFDDTINIDGVRIAFYSGNVRTSTFDVQYSLDGSNWTNVLINKVSSGTTLALETFMFNTSVSAWKVRIVGHGNSVNTWNSFTEVEFFDFVTGIDSHTFGDQFYVYPNPVIDQMNVSIQNIKGLTSLDVVVFNSVGQVVLSSKYEISNSELIIDTSKLMEGIYLVKVGNSTQLIIKQ